MDQSKPAGRVRFARETLWFSSLPRKKKLKTAENRTRGKRRRFFLRALAIYIFTLA